MFGDFPTAGDTKFTLFTPSADATTSRGWYSWRKPEGCSWIYILLVSGGGGGASATVSGAGTSRTGGGGGGGGGILRMLVPAAFVPDTLYVRCGGGGIGGIGSVGTSGKSSYVGFAPDPLSASFVNGGGGGSTTGPGGAGGNVNFGRGFDSAVFVSTSGASGGAGGINTGAVGTSITTIGMTCAGAGGAGSGSLNNVFAGGSFNPTPPVAGSTLAHFIPGGAAGVSGSVAGGNGLPGWGPMDLASYLFSRGDNALVFSGGSGGGSGGASLGGNGGVGSWGSGGGGGGAGSTAGNGGDGGPGFVLIGAF